MGNAEFQALRENLEREFRENGNQIQFTDWTDATQRDAALKEGLDGRLSKMVGRKTSSSKPQGGGGTPPATPTGGGTQPNQPPPPQGGISAGGIHIPSAQQTKNFGGGSKPNTP
jgi:hypothetical protein